MIMQKYKISSFFILFHFHEKSVSEILLGLIFLDTQLHPINFSRFLVLSRYKKTEEKEGKKTKLVRFGKTKKDAEIQSRITLHSRKQFEIISSLCWWRGIFFFLSPPPRSISVHAASLHFPAGFSTAKSRGFPKLPYSRECTRVSPSLSLALSPAQ